MVRARRLNSEEPNSTGVNIDTSTEVSEQVDDEELAIARAADDAAARILPREDLRSCTVCRREDIKPEEFRKHVTTQHKSYISGTPKGYYGCWSGQEFWLPLKFATGPCKWLCSVCGSEKYYFGKGNTHGGPATRLVDRRYGLTNCEKARYGDKYGHKRAFGKIEGHGNPVIFMHEGAPNPQQPEQTDPKLAELINAKGVSRKAKPKSSSVRVKRAARQL